MTSFSPRIYTLLIGFLLGLWSQPVLAQQAQAFIRVDSVSVGERFNLYLVTSYDEGRTRVPQTSGGTLPFGDVELFDIKRTRSIRNTQNTSPARIDTAIYEAAAFAVDSALVAPIVVRIITPRGDTTRVQTAAFYIPVRSVVPEDAAGIYDLAPLADFPYPWWFWVLLVLGVLLLAFGLWYWIQKRKQRPMQMDLPAKPVLPPFEQAMSRLRKLSQTDLHKPETLKPFYVELADLMRTYLADTLQISALEETTRELIEELHQQTRGPVPTVSEDTLQLIQKILQASDLVKFADHQPSFAQHETLLQETSKVLKRVEQTRMRHQTMLHAPTPDSHIPADA